MVSGSTRDDSKDQSLMDDEGQADLINCQDDWGFLSRFEVHRILFGIFFHFSL